jgi:predicted P-loop ATPase
MEAYELYKSGFNYHLTKEEIKLLNSSTGEFEAISSEEELILTYYALPTRETRDQIKEVTNTDILTRLNNLSGINITATGLGRALRKLGFEQSIQRFGASTKRLYKVVEL